MTETQPLSLQVPELIPNIRRKLGFMLFKPDAIRHDLVEYLIEETRLRMTQHNTGDLYGVHILQISLEQAPSLYPKFDPNKDDTVYRYISSDHSILVSFVGTGKYDIWDELEQIRGKRLAKWSEIELKNGIGLSKSIRGMMPVIGTRKELNPIIQKQILRKLDRSIKFTKEELELACQNLVHTPDNNEEFLALYNFIDKSERNIYQPFFYYQ